MSSLIPRPPRAPTIRYVDDEAPTIPVRGMNEQRARAVLERAALRGRPDTLMPTSDGEDTDADVTLRMTAPRELRAPSVGRRALILTIAAALALLAVAALRARASIALVLGADHRNPRRNVGTLVVSHAKDVVIFVDGERAGVAPDPVEVACGERRVRVGDGRTRVIDVPCEGRIEL